MDTQAKSFMSLDNINLLDVGRVNNFPGDLILSSTRFPWNGFAFEWRRINRSKILYTKILVTHPIIICIQQGHGKISYRFMGKQSHREWEPGSVIIWNAHQPIRDMEINIFSESADYFIVMLTDWKVVRLLQNEQDNKFSMIRPLTICDDSQTMTLVEAMKFEIESGCPSGSLYADSISLSLLTHISHHYSDEKSHPEVVRSGLTNIQLTETLNNIRNNLDGDLSLDMLAQNLNMSVYSFCRQFKQALGITPHQYIIQARIECSKELLIKHYDTMSIADVAIALGFSTPSHFSSVFHKFVGISPKQYQNEYTQATMDNHNRPTNKPDL